MSEANSAPEVRLLESSFEDIRGVSAHKLPARQLATLFDRGRPPKAPKRIALPECKIQPKEYTDRVPGVFCGKAQRPTLRP